MSYIMLHNVTRETKSSRLERFLYNANYWRMLAEGTRAHAEQMRDFHARRMMAGIADDYERIAERAEERMTEQRERRSPRRENRLANT